MHSEKTNIILFVGITTLLIMMLGVILVLVIYLYQQKRLVHIHSIKELTLNHEKNIVHTQLEVQENMFRHISQEIHDNIGLSLSLIKLRLTTLNLTNAEECAEQINSSIQLLAESITQLKDISKSLNSDVINNYGLLTAVNNEVDRINEVCSIKIETSLTGEPVYMDSQKELIIFRIIQESLNNIIKHSEAASATLSLNFLKDVLEIVVKDDGKGFSSLSLNTALNKGSAGIKNMESRCKMIRGKMEILSYPNAGTILKFIIPI